MTIQNPERIAAVEAALVKAGLATAGRSPDGTTFIQTSAVMIGEGAGGVAMIWLLSHPGMTGRGRNKWEMQRLRRLVEEALAGIEGVDIQAKPMGRITAYAA